MSDEPIQQAIAVTVFAELLAIHPAVLSKHVLLERPQKVVRGVTHQCGLRFSPPFDGRFHTRNLPQTNWQFNSNLRGGERGACNAGRNLVT